MREKCPYSELFWSAFSCIRTEYESPYLFLFSPNADQNNSEHGHFLHSA